MCHKHHLDLPIIQILIGLRRQSSYLCELLNLQFSGRWRCFNWLPIWGYSRRSHLLLQLINFILNRSDPPPLPSQIASPESVDKKTTHNKRMNEGKGPTFQNPKLPSNSKSILKPMKSNSRIAQTKAANKIDNRNRPVDEGRKAM